jgi:NAD(P)-dependent dehydrogenase (short-subunit alcohol dehydrogenase family)
MQELAGKVGVVTGAASGIGRGMAERLVAEGMKVVLADIEEKALDAAVRDLTDAGGKVIGVPTDVSKEESVDELAHRTMSEFGAVNLVHNNAGVALGGMLWQLTTADWQWVLGVNMWGVIHGIRAFVPLIIESGEGHVVNTASMAGVMAGPGMGPYTASKHAVVAISETLYRELDITAPQVKVSVLCPGWVDTGIAESDRNRPAELGGGVQREAAPSDQEAVRGMLAAMIQGGMPPAEVADHVVSAVREERFYVFTHPWQSMIESRMRDMIEGRNPTAVAMPT